MGKLDGKTAVITAATEGMAFATAKRFVEEGAYVFITGRRQNKLDEAIEAIGRNVVGVQGDAAHLADLDRLYETVKSENRQIDILFASAGVGGSTMLGATTEEQYDAIFNLNTRGTFFTVQKALPLLRDGGSIVMNGSLASVVKGLPGRSVYAASKAALLAFARAWLVELKDRKIRVNVLSPGTIDTTYMQTIPSELKEHYRSRVPRGELGRPEEIAAVALFLASDDAAFVNGVELFVDGGMAQV